MIEPLERKGCQSQNCSEFSLMAMKFLHHCDTMSLISLDKAKLLTLLEYTAVAENGSAIPVRFSKTYKCTKI